MRWLAWGLILQLIIFEVFQVYSVFHTRGIVEWCRRAAVVFLVISLVFIIFVLCEQDKH